MGKLAVTGVGLDLARELPTVTKASLELAGELTGGVRDIRDDPWCMSACPLEIRPMQETRGVEMACGYCLGAGAAIGDGKMQGACC